MCALEPLLGTLWASCPLTVGQVLIHSRSWFLTIGNVDFSLPLAAKLLPALGERFSTERCTGNTVLFLYSGSEKGSSVTETPVIKKHNGLHLTLPDAHDTDSGKETRFVLSCPEHVLLWELNVSFSLERVVGLCCWVLVRRSRSAFMTSSAVECVTEVCLYLSFPKYNTGVSAFFHKALWDV